MDGIKQECKLCDNIISDKNFKVVEDDIKNSFDVLLPKLAKDSGTQNVICMMCSSNLLAASSFKSLCLYTENSIIPYTDLENLTPLDLKEVYVKVKGCEQGDRMLDDWEMCRLCLHPINSDHKSIQEVPIDSIQTYIPEINFSITSNPVICMNCHDALCIHSTFLRNILLTNPYIKTEEIEIKSEGDETQFEIFCSLEKGGNEEEDKSLLSQDTLPHSAVFTDYKSIQEGDPEQHLLTHKTPYKVPTLECDRCSFTTKRKELLRRHQLRHENSCKVQMYTCDKCKFTTKNKHYILKHLLKHKDPSEVQMYRCDKCDYKSIHKYALTIHQMRHKDPSEVQMFECDECDYKSFRRAHLKHHLLTHKDPSEAPVFECKECDYKSIHKSALKIHQLRHKDPSQVRKFKCDKCDYESIQQGNLFTHQLKHKDPSEVQMFKCGNCDYKSIYKSCLKRHRLKHKDP